MAYSSRLRRSVKTQLPVMWYMKVLIHCKYLILTYLQQKSARSEIVIYKLLDTTNTAIKCQHGKHFEYMEKKPPKKTTQIELNMYSSFIKH